MSTPQRIGREKRASSAIVGHCVLHDGTCFRHERDRPLTKPRKQSLRDRDPVIAAELDEGASGFAADEVSCGASTVLAVWTCGQGHTYCATPNSRTNVRGGTGCGICASKRPTLEHNLAAVAPDLAEEWDVLRNGGLSPNQVLPQSNKRFWWACPVADDHVWKASPNNRYGRDSGCPMCSGQLPSSTNNLTLHTRLMSEWDCTGNRGIDPESITRGNSSIELSWVCSLHPSLHRPWKALAFKRVGGSGCPSCAGHVVTETNSLAALRPDLAAELDPTLVPFKTADEVSIGMNDNVWWRCPVWPDAHSWAASPNARTSGDTGCPNCNLPGSSKQEVRIAYELANVLDFDPTVHKVPFESESGAPRGLVDMVAPRLRLVVEFDGSYWHSKPGAEERDRLKAEGLRAAGWTVVRIREEPLTALSDSDVVVPVRSTTHETVVRVLLKLSQLDVLDVGTANSYARLGRLQAAPAAEKAIQDRLATKSNRR
jgi:hypothetical protein